MPLVDDIRAACAGVAARARHVRVVEAAIEPYARTLPSESPPAPDLDGASLEERAAFSLTLNAINFGSGWFPDAAQAGRALGLPHGRGRPAGARAVDGGGADRDRDARGRRRLRPGPHARLMALFTVALRELGDRVTVEYFGRFLGLVRSAEGSAERLAETLARWPTWHDVSGHDGAVVPFYKRAQIAAGDLHLAGIAPAEDIGRLTLFADNLVPHVLRLDNVLEFDERLVRRIDDGLLLEHGSPEEVEIRACALHAVELLVAAHGDTTATAVDNALWNRGALPRYKARPRHRARTTAY